MEAGLDRLAPPEHLVGWEAQRRVAMGLEPTIATLIAPHDRISGAIDL